MPTQQNYNPPGRSGGGFGSGGFGSSSNFGGSGSGGLGSGGSFGANGGVYGIGNFGQAGAIGSGQGGFQPGGRHDGNTYDQTYGGTWGSRGTLPNYGSGGAIPGFGTEGGGYGAQLPGGGAPDYGMPSDPAEMVNTGQYTQQSGSQQGGSTFRFNDPNAGFWSQNGGRGADPTGRTFGTGTEPWGESYDGPVSGGANGGQGQGAAQWQAAQNSTQYGDPIGQTQAPAPQTSSIFGPGGAFEGYGSPGGQQSQQPWTNGGLPQPPQGPSQYDLQKQASQQASQVDGGASVSGWRMSGSKPGASLGGPMGNPFGGSPNQGDGPGGDIAGRETINPFETQGKGLTRTADQNPGLYPQGQPPWMGPNPTEPYPEGDMTGGGGPGWPDPNIAGPTGGGGTYYGQGGGGPVYGNPHGQKSNAQAEQYANQNGTAPPPGMGGAPTGDGGYDPSGRTGGGFQAGPQNNPNNGTEGGVQGVYGSDWTNGGRHQGPPPPGIGGGGGGPTIDPTTGGPQYFEGPNGSGVPGTGGYFPPQQQGGGQPIEGYGDPGDGSSYRPGGVNYPGSGGHPIPVDYGQPNSPGGLSVMPPGGGDPRSQEELMGRSQEDAYAEAMAQHQAMQGQYGHPNWMTPTYNQPGRNQQNPGHGGGSYIGQGIPKSSNSRPWGGF